VPPAVLILFIDDLDGSDAEGTVRFGLDGTEYEIDLNARHAQELRDALGRYVGAAARRAGTAARRMDVLHDLMLGRPWRPPAQAFSL
jgi:Lsr2